MGKLGTVQPRCGLLCITSSHPVTVFRGAQIFCSRQFPGAWCDPLPEGVQYGAGGLQKSVTKCKLEDLGLGVVCKAAMI